jgi:hypothetical protein
LFRTLSLTTDFCLSIETRGQNHVKSDIKAHI